MKSLLEVCLVAIAMATPMAAQTAATDGNPWTPQLREGISVEMPVTSTAREMPDADRMEAVVVSVTENGSVFVGTRPINRDELAEKIRSHMAAQQSKIVYLKADSRSPFDAIVAVFDAARGVGIKTIAILTTQGEASSNRAPVPPQGFELMTR